MYDIYVYHVLDVCDKFVQILYEYLLLFGHGLHTDKYGKFRVRDLLHF
jgi:hypothetical protein